MWPMSYYSWAVWRVTLESSRWQSLPASYSATACSLITTGHMTTANLKISKNKANVKTSYACKCLLFW